MNKRHMMRSNAIIIMHTDYHLKSNVTKLQTVLRFNSKALDCASEKKVGTRALPNKQTVQSQHSGDRYPLNYAPIHAGHKRS